MKVEDKKLNYEQYFALSFRERVLYHITVESTRPMSDKEKRVQDYFDKFLKECRRRHENNEIII